MKSSLAAIAIGSAAVLASYATAQMPSFPWAKRVASTLNPDNELLP
jgi:hypothetical protein